MENASLKLEVLNLNRKCYSVQSLLGRREDLMVRHSTFQGGAPWSLNLYNEQKSKEILPWVVPIKKCLKDKFSFMEN